MSRLTIFEVKDAIRYLKEHGEKPSALNIRQLLGHGSYSSVIKFLREIEAQNGNGNGKDSVSIAATKSETVNRNGNKIAADAGTGTIAGLEVEVSAGANADTGARLDSEAFANSDNQISASLPLSALPLGNSSFNGVNTWDYLKGMADSDSQTDTSGSNTGNSHITNTTKAANTTSKDTDNVKKADTASGSKSSGSTDSTSSTDKLLASGSLIRERQQEIKRLRQHAEEAVTELNTIRRQEQDLRLEARMLIKLLTTALQSEICPEIPGDLSRAIQPVLHSNAQLKKTEAATDALRQLNNLINIYQK